MIVNRSKLAEIIGISVHTLDEQVRKGLPFIQRPGESSAKVWQFETSEVIAWREQRLRERLSSGKSIDLNDARLRKLNAEAEVAEIELEQLKKSLIRVEDVERGMYEMHSNFKNKMLAIPNKVAPHLNPGATEILRQEIREALEELSET